MKKVLELKELSVEYVDDFHRWVANKNAMKYSLSAFLPDRNTQWIKTYIESTLKNENAWNQVITVGARTIGYCGLTGISHQNQSAEYHILIGDEEYWGQGNGTVAGLKVLEYGFNELKLHRIWLTVSSVNDNAIRSYQKMGFTEEGIMREAAFRDNKFHDKVVMSILEVEYRSRQ